MPPNYAASRLCPNLHPDSQAWEAYLLLHLGLRASMQPAADLSFLPDRVSFDARYIGLQLTRPIEVIDGTGN